MKDLGISPDSIPGLSTLLDNLQQAGSLPTPDNEFFEGEELDRMAADAIAAHQRGETVEFREMGE